MASTDSPLPPYEKLGSFYLGRRYDMAAGETASEPLLYDAKDLTTHAVCVGMTGSGKTGLCVGLLEEAAIDGVPAIVIDPKGDLANLLLTFPGLTPEEFRPWIDPDEARRKNLSPDEFAAQQAELWRDGLASWGQDASRIVRLREAADMAIYTPGSEAGLPVSILSSFQAPPPQVAADGDLLRDRIASTATSLLGLLGIQADPLRSREHILLSTILDHHWREGRNLDLGALIQAIQSPPVNRVGVLDLESFYPGKERFELALGLNNLLASPSFATWMSGADLDVGKLLHTPAGKPRVAIFSIAHLSDSERMFFVSLLLNQTLSWMRTRSGTSSLRALLYMDEIFGFMPPVAEPPSKRPLLTLLKQARAYGLGVVLATQNPVDLDYKGLSNTGTWFIGRLQTERDKMRVLEGLEGATAGGRFDRGAMERLLAGLGKRVFLLHNVHENEPVVFQTRWVLSYLRGPLTRTQIRQLREGFAGGEGETGAPPQRAAPARPGAALPPTTAAPSPASSPGPSPGGPPRPAPVGPPRPVLDPDVPEVFLPPAPGATTYRPRLLGLGRVQFVDSRSKETVHLEEPALLLDPAESTLGMDWRKAEEMAVDERDLEPEPRPGLAFTELPPDLAEDRNYRSWEKDLADVLYRDRRCELLTSPDLGLRSEPGESERDFRIRLADTAREERDRRVDELRRDHADKVARLEERVRTARASLEKEQEQAKRQKLDAAISLGATLLAAFTGRSAYGSAKTTARGVSRSFKESGDIGRAEETLETRLAEIEKLEGELQEAIDGLEERFDPLRAELETESLRPRRADVEVKGVWLAWVGE